MWYHRAMEKTTLYLPTEVQRSLRALSQRTGRPQATLVREAIERYLSGQERPRPASIGAASDGTLDAAESEEWLQDQWRRGGPPTGSAISPAKPKRRSARKPERSKP